MSPPATAHSCSSSPHHAAPHGDIYNHFRQSRARSTLAAMVTPTTTLPPIRMAAAPGLLSLSSRHQFTSASILLSTEESFDDASLLAILDCALEISDEMDALLAVYGSGGSGGSGCTNHTTIGMAFQ